MKKNNTYRKKMQYSLLLILLLCSGFIWSQSPKRTELVTINGKQLYYEVYGQGEPLFLLHGYTLSSKAWQPYVNDYKDDYEVYLVDLNGHGKSDAFTGKLSLKQVAQNFLGLVDYLKLQKIKAIGFSFGGDVLYQATLAKPELISSMITIGAVGTWDVNDFKNYQEAFTFENRKNFPWLEPYHVSDHKIRALMEQFKNYVVHVSDAELQRIQPEVMIILGDNDDGIAIDQVARARKHLPNSDLWILPNVSHSAHEGETKEDFIAKSKAFLSKSKP